MNAARHSKIKIISSDVSGDNSRNCAKLSVRHHFVSFLLLVCQSGQYALTNPVKERLLAKKSLPLAERAWSCLTQGVADWKCMYWGGFYSLV